MFKAIEVDARSRQRTGREFALAVENRAAAISALLELLAARPEEVRVDPSRTLVQLGDQLWTIVAFRDPEPVQPPSLRRAGAKHKRVR